MINKSLHILLLTTLTFSVVFSKNIFYEHFFHKYHNHKSSSTTPIESSTTEISTFETSKSFTPDDITSEETASSEEESEIKFTPDVAVKKSGERDGNQGRYVFVERVVTIVGSIILFVIVLGIIVCCCPNCCNGSGTERRGFIIGRRAEVLPQPIITQTPQQPPIIQHIPPEYTQEPMQQFPPQYQHPVLPPSHYAPVQQGYHYSPVQPQSPYSPAHTQTHSTNQPGFQHAPTLQFYNPPEAPPPYEPTAPKQSHMKILTTNYQLYYKNFKKCFLK